MGVSCGCVSVSISVVVSGNVSLRVDGSGRVFLCGFGCLCGGCVSMIV